MSARPLIGVTGPARGGRAAWLWTGAAVRRAGGRALRITPGRPVPLASLQGIVVGGGADIEPVHYGEEPEGRRRRRRHDRERDALELRIIEEALSLGLPLLGICRGMQLLNVFLGGTLHQDTRSLYAGAPRLRTLLPRKRVRISERSRLASLFGAHECRVNALHRQAVRHLGSGVAPVAWEQSGIVQAIEVGAASFVLGVQWHPEYLPLERRQGALFRALVGEAALR